MDSCLTLYQLIGIILFFAYAIGFVYCFRGGNGILRSLLWPLTFLAMFFLKM